MDPNAEDAARRELDELTTMLASVGLQDAPAASQPSQEPPPPVPSEDRDHVIKGLQQVIERLQI